MPKHLTLMSSKVPTQPTVKLKRFWCGNMPFIAYELTTGEIAMSLQQCLPHYSTAFIRIANQFIADNHLTGHQAVLHNYTATTVYPLKTVMQLWNYLLSLDKLSERKELLTALLNETPITSDSTLLVMAPEIFRERVEFQPANLAQVVSLQIGEFFLKLLLQNDKYYLSEDMGLNVIGAPVTLLIELNGGQKKNFLSKNGFSFRTEQLFIEEETGIFQLKARSWTDWLIVWKYSAWKGNRNSLNLLWHLASKSLEEILNNKLSMNHEQETTSSPVQACENPSYSGIGHGA